MSKQLELSRWEAKKRLLLFLKLRKSKTITDQTLKDFEKLMDKMDDNFKTHLEKTIWQSEIDDYNTQGLALKAIRCQFMEFENGGNCRLPDIDSFSLYMDDKYKVSIKGQLREITTRDFNVLSYVFFGEEG